MKRLIGGIFCLVFGGIGIVIASSVLRGIVLVKLWQWFVVSSLGLPVLSIPVAIGISMIVSFLTTTRMPKEDDNFEPGKMLGIVVFYPLFVLFFGWIIHFFV